VKTDYEAIYLERAEDYDRLVDAEDCDGRLLPAIERVSKLAGADVLEVGCGTGRITRQLVRRGARVVGFDRAEPMLEVARQRLREIGDGGWTLHRADAEDLPVTPSSFDLAVAGWVFGHLRSWRAADWRAAIGRCLDAMHRAVRPGGALIVIETLGTGSERPHAPTPELAEYYAWLETERGFSRAELRTDYLFTDADAAARTMGFFFGPAMAERILQERWTRVPECTGLWSRAR